MTKEEKIKEAWLWINVQIPFDLDEISNCNEDGWLKYGSKQSSMQSEFLEEKQWLGYFFYRPKSLQGIENNNGWIKIESIGDLLNPDDISSEYNCNDNVWSKRIDGFISIISFEELFQHWDNYSHFQLIEKPKSPIF